MGTGGGRQYREYSISWGDWQYQAGSRREIRGPTDAAIEVIDGAAKTVDIGSHPNKTYEEVPKNKPKYVVYLATEDQRNRYGEKKFTKRINRHQGANA